MDNDSTTIAKLREINPNILKLSDRNHTRKSISNALYSLAKDHSALRNKKTLNYILRMFTYAIEQKQENITGLQTRLREIVPHIFGTHDLCSHEWCSYNENLTNFEYSSLPFKKPLTYAALKLALESLTEQYINKADRLAHKGSSQANESFNNIVVSKAPKAR